MKAKAKPILYLISPDLKWKAFKKLHDKLVPPDGGPSPKNFERILWEMIRAKRIYGGFRDDMKNDMWLGLTIPKKYEVRVITNP
jgi:hypothetical protein